MPAAAIIALLALFTLVQIGDVITTAIVLGRGGRELNPVMAWAMRTIGLNATLAVKLLIAAGIGVFAALEAPIALIPLCAIGVFVVIHNWRQI